MPVPAILPNTGLLLLWLPLTVLAGGAPAPGPAVHRHSARSVPARQHRGSRGVWYAETCVQRSTYFHHRPVANHGHGQRRHLERHPPQDTDPWTAVSMLKCVQHLSPYDTFYHLVIKYGQISLMVVLIGEARKSSQFEVEGLKALYWKHAAEPWSITCHMGSHNVTCHPTQVNVFCRKPSQTPWYSSYLH